MTFFYGRSTRLPQGCTIKSLSDQIGKRARQTEKEVTQDLDLQSTSCVAYPMNNPPLRPNELAHSATNDDQTRVEMRRHDDARVGTQRVIIPGNTMKVLVKERP
jgi:hypothetical protein